MSLPFVCRHAARLLVTAAVATAGSDVTAAGYRVVAQYPVAGEGGWDYLTFDPARQRLFVTRGTHVLVVDPANGQVTGQINDTPGVHGVALAGDLGKGYVSDGRTDAVTVFDLASLGTRGTVETPDGKGPDAIAYDAATRQVVAFNGGSHNASIIDATTDRLVATLPLDGKPESSAGDGRGMLYVAIEDRDEVVAVDLVTRSVVDRFAMRGCDEPAGLALDTKARRLFVGCHNRKMIVFDVGLRSVIATLPIGEGVDAVAFDAGRKVAVSSQGDGTMTVVGEGSGGRYKVLQTLMTRRSARTLALDPGSHRIYLVAAEFSGSAAVAGSPRPRRVMRPHSFVLLVVGDEGKPAP